MIQRAAPDQSPELLAKATKQKLTEAEVGVLAESLRAHEPWLEWAGKRETRSFAVDPVALHIHERDVSPNSRAQYSSYCDSTRFTVTTLDSLPVRNECERSYFISILSRASECS